MRLMPGALVALLAFSGAGCGDSGDQEQAVKSDVLAAARAFTSRDAPRACGYVTPAGKKVLVDAFNSGPERVADTCEDAARAEFEVGPLNLRPNKLVLGDVVVTGERATIELGDKRFPGEFVKARMRKVGSRWRFDGDTEPSSLPHGD